MSKFVFKVLLVGMIALRGFMGDAMAFGHLGHTHGGAAPTAQAQAEHSAGADHAGHTHHVGENDSCCPEADGPCSLCPVCHSAFHANAQAPADPKTAPQAPAARASARWLDAELRAPAEPPRH